MIENSVREDSNVCTALSRQPIHFLHWVRARSLDQHWGCVCRGRHPRRHLTISCPACGASSVALARGCPLGLRLPQPPPRPFAFQTPASPALVPAPPVFCSSPVNQNWRCVTIMSKCCLILKILRNHKFSTVF